MYLAFLSVMQNLTRAESELFEMHEKISVYFLLRAIIRIQKKFGIRVFAPNATKNQVPDKDIRLSVTSLIDKCLVFVNHDGKKIPAKNWTVH